MFYCVGEKEEEKLPRDFFLEVCAVVGQLLRVKSWRVGVTVRAVYIVVFRSIG